jgi:SAM-dependent methyltransferase
MNYFRDKDYLVSEKQFKNIFQKRFNLMRPHLSHPLGGQVLEIGCSNGVFLDLFTQWETWGVEPSGSAERAKEKGHKIIKNYFEKAELPENHFDLVIMNHILEHLDNPAWALARAHKLLRRNGLVFIDVPNFGGLGSKILGKHWPYLLSEEHKHQFTQRSLTSLLEKSGFKVIHWESRSGLFEYANPFLELWQALIGFKKRFFFDILTSPYCLVATALNMGDSMSIIGKKED